jgi:hypothetical protein
MEGRNSRPRPQYRSNLSPAFTLAALKPLTRQDWTLITPFAGGSPYLSSIHSQNILDAPLNLICHDHANGSPFDPTKDEPFVRDAHDDGGAYDNTYRPVCRNDIEPREKHTTTGNGSSTWSLAI